MMKKKTNILSREIQLESYLFTWDGDQMDRYGLRLKWKHFKKIVIILKYFLLAIIMLEEASIVLALKMEYTES